MALLNVIGILLLHALLWLLCLTGIGLSCLSFTGTWLIAFAALIAAWLGGDAFPGWITVALLFLLSAFIELIELVAGHWGVTRRQGSRLAGIAAVVGGLIGMFAGALLPIFLLGPLLGMCAGSFGLSYLVERHRQRTHAEAAHVARGALLARVGVIVLKVTAAIATTIILLSGFYYQSPR